MSGLFPSVPHRATPSVPTMADPAIDTARKSELQSDAATYGRLQTILTGPQGTAGQTAQIQRKTLLGG